MPLDSKNPEYLRAEPLWQKINHVLGGEEAVKEAGIIYLPQLDGQDDEDYQMYKARGMFFNATGRTQLAMLGFLFRKDPVVKPDLEAMAQQPVLASFIADATLTGKSLYDLAKDDIASKVTGTGRCATIVDWDPIEERPFVAFYDEMSVINWRYERVNGKMALTSLILFERSPKYQDVGDGDKPADSYERVLYDQWREWRLAKDADGNRYVIVTVWRRRKGKSQSVSQSENLKRATLKGTGPAPGAGVTGSEDFVAIDSFYPVRGPQPLDFIPCTFHPGPDGDCIERPVLLDMANINLSHYRTSVDLENALHVLGIPTPWAVGFAEKEGADLEIGLQTVWVSSEANAKCGFLELSGTGLKNLVDAMERKEKHMAALGARMLDPQSHTRYPEAFATVALRQSGETAITMGMSLALTQSISYMLAIAYWWCNRSSPDVEDATKKVQYTLNTDFLETTLDATTVTALLASYIQGAISFETLFWKLQQGEWIPGDRTPEEEKQLIAEGQSTLMQFGAIPDPNAQQQQPNPNDAQQHDSTDPTLA